MNGQKITITNISIFEPLQNKIIEKGSIIIENNKIKEIGSENEIEIPEDSKIIDGKKRIALPGLIDAHLHIDGFKTGDSLKESLTTPIGVRFARGIKDLEKLIDAGYTSVVDAGGIIGLHLRDAVNEKTISGPRIFAAGFFLTPTFGHADIHYLPADYVDVRSSKFMYTQEMTSLLCDGIDECRKSSRYALRQNPNFLKVMATGGILSQKDRPDYRGFTLDELKVIVEEASAANRFVHAHAQGKVGILNSLNAGVKVIAHAIYIDEETSLLAKEKGAVIVPTLSIIHKIIDKGKEAGIPEWSLKKAEEVFEINIENIKIAKKIGVKLATGSDFYGANFCPHGENSYELKLFVDKLGMSPKEAIISATKIAAEATSMNDYIGTLSKGKFADLILLRESPLDDINKILDKKNIEFVMVDGIILKDKINQ
jgi:imidazolonepropionase-like amidohydrolase